MALINSRRNTVADWISDKLIRLALSVILRLPFECRRRLTAELMAHLVAPLAGWRTRIRQNLDLVCAEMPEAERRRLEREVPRSIGRTLAELYSGSDFVDRVAREPLQGPGVIALEAAFRTRRPVLLITGHLGNYDAIRGGLIARGYPVCGLYRPMDNPYFNEHYVSAISRIGTPLFPRGRRGLTEMVRFLKGGGMVGIVLDQAPQDGSKLQFFGRTALTSLSPAEMALRYDALVIPAYGIRRADGGFDLIIEEPISEREPIAITQRLNDSLEMQVRAHMDQWLWTHRRWKMPS